MRVGRVACGKVVEGDARLRVASANAEDAHEQLSRVEAEAGQPEHEAANRADVVRPKTVVAVQTRRFDGRIEHPQGPAVEHRDTARSDKQIAAFADQHAGRGERACAASQERDARVRSAHRGAAA